MTDEQALPEGTYGTWDGRQWHPGALGVWDGSGFVALGLGNPALNSTPQGPVAHPLMTDEEAAETMRGIAGIGDPEAAHSAADKMLTELLTLLGYPQTVEAYESVDKWYA